MELVEYTLDTDLAYKQAVDDGADYIDCPVQVIKDGTLICLTSTHLTSSTTAATSSLNSCSSVIPEIQSDRGIFTFNLTWQEIQKSLKQHLGFSVSDAVLNALDNSSYNNQTRLEVIIQSRDSSVLKKMRQKTKYKLVYIDEFMGDAVSSSIKDIAGFAHSVAIHKESIYPKSAAFIVGKTDLVAKFQSANLLVFAYLFMNEFISQPWDFYSDATMEINMYFQQAGVDGIITDFPGTAVAYRRNTWMTRNLDICFWSSLQVCCLSCLRQCHLCYHQCRL